LDAQCTSRVLICLPEPANLGALLFIREVNMVPQNKALLGFIGLFLGVFLVAQGTGYAQTTEYKLKTVSISTSQPASGQQMYQDYCAVCHGLNGEGNGPAVQFLKAPPPDLTTMAKRHNEKSVVQNVDGVLRFQNGTKAHGTLDMPTWGPLFKKLDSSPSVAQIRIHNLAQYVQSMQKN
jgi:mono/diheme cytochrome c family protein